LDANERDVMDGEEKSLYHLFKSSKRREARTIRRMQDRGGRITNDPKEIEHIFVTYLTDKYGSVDVADNCITEMVNVIRSHTQPSCVAYLEQSIRAEELYTAIMSGGPNKSPRSDGIGREFFLHLWDTIRDDMLQVLNHMNLNKSTTRRQQHGIIFTLPKNNGDFTPAGYRSISLMNTDYKLLARIMARRLTSVLEEHLTSGQYCSVPGRSILEAVSVIRDVVAHAELTRTHVCVLSLDFRNAFDRVSHHYLFTILAGYGLSEWFIDRVHSIFEQATSSVQINGRLAGPIPIRCAVRQGCPLSMALHALCVHPLLRTLEERLTGITIGTRGQKILVLAYADDITIFITRREEIEIVNTAIRI